MSIEDEIIDIELVKSFVEHIREKSPDIGTRRLMLSLARAMGEYACDIAGAFSDQALNEITRALWSSFDEASRPDCGSHNMEELTHA